MTTNILIITNELKHVCGVSNHIKNLITGFGKEFPDYNFIILCGKKEEGISEAFKCEIIVDDNLLHSRRKYLSFLGAVLKVRKVIKKRNINLIHSHTHYAANIALKAVTFKKIKTVQTNHGILTEAGKLNHYNADFYIVLSERIKNHLLAQGIDSKNIKIINQGISVEFIPRRRPQNDKLIVFSASRFIKGKAMDVFIKAANEINNQLPGLCQFCISGEGELENELKSLNKTEGGSVIFINPKSDYNIILRKAHIFVFNSVSLTEGIPIVLLEAIFSGCKVLTSSFWGYNDVFEGSEDIIIYELGNLDDLISKLRNAILNYQGNINSDITHEKLRKEYSLINMIIKHKELYSEIINKE